MLFFKIHSHPCMVDDQIVSTATGSLYFFKIQIYISYKWFMIQSCNMLSYNSLKQTNTHPYNVKVCHITIKYKHTSSCDYGQSQCHENPPFGFNTPLAHPHMIQYQIMSKLWNLTTQNGKNEPIKLQKRGKGVGEHTRTHKNLKSPSCFNISGWYIFRGEKTAWAKWEYQSHW